jgi:hypothetical protein
VLNIKFEEFEPEFELVGILQVKVRCAGGEALKCIERGASPIAFIFRHVGLLRHVG